MSRRVVVEDGVLIREGITGLITRFGHQVVAAVVAKHIGSVLAKLELPPDEDYHLRVRVVLAYLQG